MTTPDGRSGAQELEATLGLGLEHPNIVRTYDYATRTTGPVRFKDFFCFRLTHYWLPVPPPVSCLCHPCHAADS